MKNAFSLILRHMPRISTWIALAMIASGFWLYISLGMRLRFPVTVTAGALAIWYLLRDFSFPLMQFDKKAAPRSRPRRSLKS